MQITGIEVVGHKTPVGVGAVPGEKVELTYGETLRVNVSFDYRGVAKTVTLYGAIGKRGLIAFDEILYGEQQIDLPVSFEFAPQTASIEISITSPISPGTDYDLYCKIKEYPGAGMPEVDDVIDIVGIPPTMELIQHTIHHFAYIYDGDVEVTTATFKIDPFTPSAWAAKKFADTLESEARKKGARVLETKVYVDTTPLLWTNIRIEVVGTPLGAEVASGIAVGIPVWLAIILIALAIIAVIVAVTLAIKTITESFKTYPGLEDVKPAWGKEALILDIQDAEEHWERPLTPVETLEGMSEAELRDLLDQIAEEEVPPKEISPWAIAALVGGLGVVGVGAAVALTARRKE